MHSSLRKGLFLVTFLGMTVSPGISVMAADGETSEATKMPGVGIEAVLNDVYSQNREIKAEDYLVPENKGEYLDMAFANVTSFLYVRSEPTKESEYVGKLYPGYAAKITGPVGEWTAVESGDVTGYVKTEYILTGAEAQTYAENLVTEAQQEGREEAFTYAEYLNTLAKLTPLKEKTQFYYALFSENGFDEKITADTKSSGTLLFSLEQIVNYS